MILDKEVDILTRIKELREALGLTQIQLGEKIGVGQSAVASWETGVAIPRSDKLPELAKILNCTIDELFRG